MSISVEDTSALSFTPSRRGPSQALPLPTPSTPAPSRHSSQPQPLLLCPGARYPFATLEALREDGANTVLVLQDRQRNSDVRDEEPVLPRLDGLWIDDQRERFILYPRRPKLPGTAHPKAHLFTLKEGVGVKDMEYVGLCGVKLLHVPASLTEEEGKAVDWPSDVRRGRRQVHDGRAVDLEVCYVEHNFVGDQSSLRQLQRADRAADTDDTRRNPSHQRRVALAIQDIRGLKDWFWRWHIWPLYDQYSDVSKQRLDIFWLDRDRFLVCSSFAQKLVTDICREDDDVLGEGKMIPANLFVGQPGTGDDKYDKVMELRKACGERSYVDGEHRGATQFVQSLGAVCNFQRAEMYHIRVEHTGNDDDLLRLLSTSVLDSC